MRDGLGHLVESLLDIAGNDEDVAGIAKIELLENIDATVEPVAVVERGDAPHRLRSEPRSRTVGGGRSKGAPTKAASKLPILRMSSQ